LLSEFKKDNGIDLKSDKLALQRLKEAAEKAKIELSSAAQTEINLPFITADKTGPKHINLKMTRAKLEALGGYKMQSDVEKILPKLGFSIEDADKLVGNFSGGWQMKVALGKIILQKPDLLLLDEPTNHLDLETIFWLEEYLSSLKIAVIIISHDRYFLDKLCKKIIFVDKGISETFNGNYSFFVEQKSLNEESQNKTYQLQQKEIEIQKKYIERFRASATRSSQAKSREKQ